MRNDLSRSDRPFRPGRTLWPRRAGWALVALRTGWPRRTDRALCPPWTGIPLDALRAGVASRALRPRVALWSLCPGVTFVALGSLGVADGDGQVALVARRHRRRCALGDVVDDALGRRGPGYGLRSQTSGERAIRAGDVRDDDRC